MNASKFSIVPRIVWQGCQPTEIKVYCCLASYADWDTGVCWPSHQTIAKDLNVSLATVKRALRNLQAAGVIQIVHRSDGGDQQTNLYKLPFAINRGVKSDPRWGHTRPDPRVKYDPQTRTNELQGVKTKNLPSQCAHLPLDEDGYCTACESEVA